MLSVFLIGTLDEKIEFCYKIYDLDSEGIHRETMMTLMRGILISKNKENVEEGVKDLVEILMKKMDIDLDGIISFEDYNKSVHENPMLMECLGPLLPTRGYVHAFLMTFTDRKTDF